MSAVGAAAVRGEVAAPVESTADIAIVGGGMVGASLALALRGSSHRVALIEAARPRAADASTDVDARVDAHASFDDRTTALGNGACRVLETLGLWRALRECAAPIRHIHVSEAGRFGFARLDAAQQGLDAFGYSMANRHIGKVLWDALTQGTGVSVDGIELLAPARVTTLQPDGDAVRLTVAGEQGATRQLAARLVVAADGAHSQVALAAGIGSVSASYEQVAVIANLRSDRPATGTAYERFKDSGPMALLPLFNGGYTAVWTLSPAAAEQALRLDEAAFCDQLQRCFGWRAGRFLGAGRRASYPLALTRASAPAAARTVVVGNAAQALHPVAAQGFNLGLRDAALLAEMLIDAADPGDAALLAEYGRRRAADRDGMVRFTDTLVKLFGDSRRGPRVLRDLGLLLFDVMPPAKQALSRLSWGFGAGLPKLVRGVPLR